MPLVTVKLTDVQAQQYSRTILDHLPRLASQIMRTYEQRIHVYIEGWGADRSVNHLPLIHFEIIEDRPAEQHRALIEQGTAFLADVLGCPPADVRIYITEIPAALWGMGGTPATEVLADEIAARRAHAAAGSADGGSHDDV